MGDGGLAIVAYLLHWFDRGQLFCRDLRAAKSSKDFPSTFARFGHFRYGKFGLLFQPYKVVEVTGDTPLIIKVGGQLSVSVVKESRYLT